MLAIILGLLVAGCGESPDSAIDGSSEGPSSEAVPGAPAALDPSEIPADERSLLRVLQAMPDEILGRTKEQSDGDVVYRSEGAADVFLSAMEAEDVSAGEESNRELLDIEARRPGRVVTDRDTDPGAELIYVRGTEGGAPDMIHFMAWATPEGPFLFAAGADTAEHLDAVVTAFAEAAAST